MPRPPDFLQDPDAGPVLVLLHLADHLPGPRALGSVANGVFWLPRWTLCVPAAQPDQDGTSPEIDLVHDADLPVAFRDIVLVDTDGVDPEQFESVSIVAAAEKDEGVVEIPPDHKWAAIESDSVARLVGAPSVRERPELGPAAKGDLDQTAEQRVIIVCGWLDPDQPDAVVAEPSPSIRARVVPSWSRHADGVV